MVKVKLTVGDNSNSSYHKEITAIISSVDYLVYTDGMNYCSSDDYDAAWERICNNIAKDNNLPVDWYVDSGLDCLEILL